MFFLEITSFSLLIVSFIFSIIEYVFLKKMVSFYYKNGPFTKKATFKSMPEKKILIEKLNSEKLKRIFSFKVLDDSMLISFRPSTVLWFLKKEFLTQRIIINFPKGDSHSVIECEIRPYYSVFLLPISIVLFMIFNIILPNQYSGISMKIVGSIIACFIGLALFFPFRPRTDSLNRIKNYLSYSEIKNNEK
ncbi:MAG: hypothetical protein ACMUIU_14790 [bacterium]